MLTNKEFDKRSNLDYFIELTIDILVISFFSSIITFVIITEFTPIMVFMLLVITYSSNQLVDDLRDGEISLIEFIGWSTVLGILVGLISVIIALIFL